MVKNKQVHQEGPFKFSWKTPDRKLGNRVLPLLANEIYLAVFDNLEPSESPADMEPDESAEYRTTFSNLALVCRFFCAECLPRVFRSMEFSGRRHGKEAPSYSKFCRGLVAGEGEGTASYLGKHVRACTIAHWMRAKEKGAWVFANFLKLYIKSIPRLIHLETLRIHSTPLDLNFIAALGSLEKLRSLSLMGCEFISMTKDLPTLSTPLALTQFELFHHRNGDEEQDEHYDEESALVAHLSDLVSSRSLRSLRTDSRAFLDRFLSQKLSFALEMLAFTLFASQVPQLLDFLKRTPSIYKIQIEEMELVGVFARYPSSLRDLSPSALPHLRELECLTPHAEWLVPGRPVQSITAKPFVAHGFPGLSAAQGDAQRVLSILKRSTAVITTLRTHKDMYMIPSFNQSFPRLETLVLDFHNYDPVLYDPELIKEICKISLHPPPLTTIHLVFESDGMTPWSLDLALQSELVRDIATAFPTLLRVRISDEVEWHRLRDRNDVWDPTIVRGQKVSLRNSLKDHLRVQRSGAVKDCGRCFAGLFDLSSAIDQVYLREMGYAIADDKGPASDSEI